MKRFLLTFALVAVLLPAQARIVEEQFDLPVTVHDAYGKEIAQAIRVTVFRDDATRAPQPLAIINHGRAPEAASRAEMGRARYSDASRWFVHQGFVVAVPTRIGYGVSGGEDVEDTGACQAKRYEPGYAAAAEQTLAVLASMRTRADVQKDRSLVLGQSYGGATAITVAALDPPGVAAAINFAGGGGGNPKTQPGRPCAPHLLQRMFAGYGKTARLPTLWIYAQNDLFLGATYPPQWFEAFRHAGGVGEFIQFPPAGDDGHSLFTKFPATWQPVVADFLHRQGYPLIEEAAR